MFGSVLTAVPIADVFNKPIIGLNFAYLCNELYDNSNNSSGSGSSSSRSSNRNQ